MRKQKKDLILDGALPVMRDYIIQTWWTTGLPVQASKGDADVRERAGLGPNSNPAGWWGRAWSAVEAGRRGEKPRDGWMILRFEPLFRGLSRPSDRKPYSYEVADPSECPPPQVEAERAIAMWDEDQGRVEGTEERRALEEAGMRESRMWLKGEGFTDGQIKDVHATKPWDLEAERDGTKWYVEAKGSRSAWSDDFTVVVTPNEVLHARRYPENCTLVIAAACKLTRGSDGRMLAAANQVVVVSPWQPLDGDLSPVGFRYRPGLMRGILQLRATNAARIRGASRTSSPANKRLQPSASRGRERRG